jgi:hypothetical protein
MTKSEHVDVARRRVQARIGRGDSLVFDRFSRPARSCESPCAKFFPHVRPSLMSARAAPKPFDVACIPRCQSVDRLLWATCKNTLSHRMFFNSHARARNRVADVVCMRARCADERVSMRVRRVDVRRIHTSLSGKLLFSLCCSKRNAVRFDSRCALKRHRHDLMARRAANG